MDLLNFAPSPVLETDDDSRHGAAYLQCTSGSTRTPAGVIVSHANVITNLEQAMDDYFEGSATAPAPITRLWRGRLTNAVCRRADRNTQVIVSRTQGDRQAVRRGPLPSEHGIPTTSSSPVRAAGYLVGASAVFGARAGLGIRAEN